VSQNFILKREIGCEKREKKREKRAKLTTDLANLRFRDKTLF